MVAPFSTPHTVDWGGAVVIGGMMSALRVMGVLGVLGGAVGIERCPTPSPGLCADAAPNKTAGPTSPKCSCVVLLLVVLVLPRRSDC